MKTKLVRPIREVELKHRGEYLVFKTDTWYECGDVNDEIYDKVFIDVTSFNDPNGFKNTGTAYYAWPYNTLQIFRNTFEQLFVCKEEDREIKINELLDDKKEER